MIVENNKIYDAFTENKYYLTYVTVYDKKVHSTYENGVKSFVVTEDSYNAKYELKEKNKNKLDLLKLGYDQEDLIDAIKYWAQNEH